MNVIRGERRRAVASEDRLAVMPGHFNVWLEDSCKTSVGK